MFPNFQNYFPPGMGKGSRPQRILWRSIWANYFPALIPFHFLCEGNNFTLLPTSLSTNMCDQRIILAEKNRTALNMILFHTGYTDWVTIRYLFHWLHWLSHNYIFQTKKDQKKVLQGRAPCCIPLLCWWRTRANYICIVERNWWLLVTNERGSLSLLSFFLLFLVGLVRH